MRHGILAFAAALLCAAVSSAQCPPSCPVPGGGAAATDCLAEFAGTGIRNNYPSYDPLKPKPAKQVRCFDGDAACDLDGQVNHACQFDIDVCLRNADAALPTCTPADVIAATVSKASDDAALAALQSSLNGLLPATTNVCSSGQTLIVPLKGPNGRGQYAPAKRTIAVKTQSSSSRDSDKLKLMCVPRDWPSHGYDHTNARSTSSETLLSPANAGQLVQKWNLPLTDGGGNGVTATPTVGFGLVYVASWNGRIYGVQASNGKIKWTYDTNAAFSGVQSSPTLTADGRLVFGDSDGRIHCLLAKTGRVLWTTLVGGPIDHVWASPQVVDGRVFVGTASHTDSPCAPGYFHAFDLNTGTLLWTRRTVPDRICNTDTSLTCSTDADCSGAPGSCVAGCGAGVTATAAVSADGATIYVGTVGSFTFPSIGDSETIFALDPASGAVQWKFRSQTSEQFADGPPYHDWGFLNRPMLIEGDDGLGGTRPLVVAAGKEGSIYALDPASGAPVWTRPVIPPPDFGGFGLFNGAIGFADHRIVAALYSPGASWPASNDHLFSFSDLDASTAWSAQIGQSWSHIALANGLVFAGTLETPELFVYDAASGARLRTLALPDASSSGPSVVNGTVYVGYGIFGAPGGVAAFGLP